MNSLKLLLIKPYNISDHIQPSLGLGYLAQAVRSICQVQILDCIKENLWGEKLIDYIRKLSPDIVGFQLYTYDLESVRSELCLIKKNFPHIITIVGGPHPSAIAEKTFKSMDGTLDFIFCGESETALPKFIDMIKHEGASNYKKIKENDLKNIPGLSWFSNGRIFRNPVTIIENLDSTGFPAWDIIKPQTYPEAQHGAFFRNFPIAPIMTGRGCPFSCTFCEGHIITGKKVRKRSVANVIEEIKILVKDYGIREIHVVDDNFSIYKEYVMEFCESLLREGLKISWATPNGIRIDSIDRDMLLLMKKSGYYLASVGIEFGSERMFKVTKKALDKEKIINGIKLIRSVGLEAAGFFMMGYPGETEQEINETIKFALSLPLLRANFFIFLPLPGTEAYKLLESTKQLEKVDWKHFYFTHPVYTSAGLSADKLKNLQRKAFLEFYLRPHIFILNLAQVRTLRQAKFLLRRAFRWVIAA
jgi:radical SAM superfamily enzyme YgiQ (UPF0313 family)